MKAKQTTFATLIVTLLGSTTTHAEDASGYAVIIICKSARGMCDV